MKLDWNKKYNTIAAYAIIVLIVSIIFYLTVSEVNLVKLQIGKYLTTLHPIFIGMAMAYLFNFILEIYEDKLLAKFLDDKFSPKVKRFLGLILTYSTVIILLILFLNFMLPQLVSSVKGLVNSIPEYVKEIGRWLEALETNFNIPEEYINMILEKWDQAMDMVVQFATSLIPKIGNMAKNMLSSIWNIVLGVVVSIYLLIEKEKFKAIIKKVVTASFSQKNKEILFELTNRADTIFGKFLSGKILDSIIIGFLTFIILKITKMPYTMLVSFIVGVTNIIPFFGPFIGAVPSFFIIFFESPVKAFTFLILIVIIQQIDGNIIGPKILGDSLGISAFWILFSLLVAGKLFGFIGLVIGVPLFVFIYSIIKDIVESKLQKRNLPYKTEDYM